MALESTDAVAAHRILRKDPATIRADFPIADALEGWFFRQREISWGAYVVDGTDLWGRVLSRQGGDPDVLLSQCVDDARSIENESKGAF